MGDLGCVQARSRRRVDSVSVRNRTPRIIYARRQASGDVRFIWENAYSWFETYPTCWALLQAMRDQLPSSLLEDRADGTY